jgi:hypothetical protein
MTLYADQRVLVHPVKSNMGLWMVENEEKTELRMLSVCCEAPLWWRPVGKEEAMYSTHHDAVYCSDCRKDIPKQPATTARTVYSLNSPMPRSDFERTLQNWVTIWTERSDFKVEVDYDR